MKTETQKIDFTSACVNDSSTSELVDALLARAADLTDCTAWRITPTEWREAIADALKIKIRYLKDEIFDLKK